jgi:hypothetical protein
VHLKALLVQAYHLTPLGGGAPPPYQSKLPEQEIFRLFLFLRQRQIQD